MFDLPISKNTSKPSYYYLGMGVGILILFLSIYYLTSVILDSQSLNINEAGSSNNLISNSSETSYTGRVRYVDPKLYQADGISYLLIDDSGNEIALLKTTDEKLALAEGMKVTVFGTKSTSADGKSNIIFVNKLVLSGDR